MHTADFSCPPAGHMNGQWADQNAQTKRWDALIIGGSFAGLSAALQLARAQKHVLILDSATPRNRFARSAHGLLALDGLSPAEVRQQALDAVLAYPTVQYRQTPVSRVSAQSCGGFSAAGSALAPVTGRTLLLATGVQDQLPAIDGLTERWGQTVLHCPYCHGYELRGQPVVVIGGSVHSPLQAALLPDWGPTTYCTQGRFLPDAEQAALLAKRGVQVEHSPVVALEGQAPALRAVRLADGRSLPAGAVYVAPQTTLAPAGETSLAAQLGLTLEAGMTGFYIQTNEMKQSSVPGVFAAGDNAGAMHNATLATAAGALAGFAMHRYLLEQQCL